MDKRDQKTYTCDTSREDKREVPEVPKDSEKPTPHRDMDTPIINKDRPSKKQETLINTSPKVQKKEVVVRHKDLKNTLACRINSYTKL